MTGSVCLCSMSALKIGAGLVTIAVPDSISPIVSVKITEPMIMSLPSTSDGTINYRAVKHIFKSISRYNVLAIGCGGSRNRSSARFFRYIVKNTAQGIVVDADAINAFSGNPDDLADRKTDKLVLTPHSGEFSRLINKDKILVEKDRKTLAKDFALKYNLVLVLKGDKTIVTDGKTLYENDTGNPGMATAGMGDCLTGIIAGLMAQNLSALDSACLGVYLHGLAGDIAVLDKTQYCIIAQDIIDYLPVAIKQTIHMDKPA